MKKPSGLFFLILFLATMAGGLIAWRVFILPPMPFFPTATPSPTPASKFVFPSPAQEKGDSPEELLRSLKEKFPLIEFLPHQTETYTIDYRAPLHLGVKLRVATKSATMEKEVLDWIWAKGVNPSTHQIDWFTPEL